jgi:hypothetical protein
MIARIYQPALVDSISNETWIFAEGNYTPNGIQRSPPFHRFFCHQRWKKELNYLRDMFVVCRKKFMVVPALLNVFVVRQTSVTLEPYHVQLEVSRSIFFFFVIHSKQQYYFLNRNLWYIKSKLLWWIMLQVDNNRFVQHALCNCVSNELHRCKHIYY